MHTNDVAESNIWRIFISAVTLTNATFAETDRKLAIDISVPIGKLLRMPILRIFLFLQVMDLLTTLIGFRLGASEASPFIAKLIHSSTPTAGVVASKLIALGIGGLCIALKRIRLLRLINIWYAALALWNLAVIVSIFFRSAQ